MLTKIEVEIPDGVAASPDDRLALKDAVEAMLALRYERSPAFRDGLRSLEDQGWAVHWRLGWHVTAKRGADFEEATGRTLEEALSGVVQLARTDGADGWP